MSTRHTRLILILILITLSGVALAIWLGRDTPVAVIVKPVGYGVVQNTVANTRAGTIKACRRAGLSPSLGGQIINLPAREGDAVKPGQLLMELWNIDRKAQVDLARSQVTSSEASARQVCTRADTAYRESQRLQKLREEGLASEEAIDKAEGEARARKAACKAARASIGVSRARLDVARAALAQTRITAPFAGIVAEVNGEIGEYVTPSPVGIPTPPAVDLVDITCLYVSAPIDEVDAPRIRVGMPAHISLDAFPGRTFAGTVRRVAPYVLDIQKQARTVDVEVRFDDKADTDNMLPGYSADIEVILAQRDQALRIPTEAILEGNRVLRFGPDGLLRERSIQTGLSNWAWTEITDGLSAGDEVVISVDRDGVQDGARAVRDTQAGADD
ncbi:MAG TPA: efflux RND transporter periplasmic adaptor subunit [Chromatiales bacterium]|nr:efflux RND transporter periplasmic adaptor subunit [Chromatiales bacterium]